LTLPFEPIILGHKLNIHLILEYLAFFIAFRYYVYLKKKSLDLIPNSNRLSIILGAAIGAFLGSRIIAFLENPSFTFNISHLFSLLQSKTIMGGLFGGLIGVEIAKKIIKEKRPSGDLFVFPIIVGIFIGRIGCFLSGISEFTYGKVTKFMLGMNLGDNLIRHPIMLYELFFLICLFVFLQKMKQYKTENGILFKYFMIAYFSFRFFIEFLKPNVFYVGLLSSIQILCLICLLYYRKTIFKIFKNASQKIYLL
jgi:phosphatidylglycerol---prolipoprotein diacylglyceryl transferase